MISTESYEDRLHYSNVINFLDRKLEMKKKKEEKAFFSKTESIEDIEDVEDEDERSVFNDIGVFISMMLLVWFMFFCYLIRV